MDEHLHLFILEDDPSLRENLAEFLIRRGFAVRTAGSIAEADQVLADRALPDAVLLDNHLKGESMSGAEYGRLLRARWLGDDAPEFLIYSGERDIHYVRQGIDLVMDYFSKEAYGVAELVVPLRVAVLRKAVRWERRPGKLAVLRRIAAEAAHRDAAVAAFSRDVLLPALSRALTNRFCLVYTDLDGSVRIDNLETGSVPVYGELSVSATPEPRVCNLPIPGFHEQAGAVVLELYSRGPCRLILAIAEGLPGERTANDAADLARAMQRYLVPVLYSALESLVEIMRGMQDAFVAGFTRGNAMWLLHLKTLRQCLQSGDPAGMGLLETWIESAAWHASEGQALLAGDEPPVLGLNISRRSVDGVGPSLFALARTQWTDLGGRAENLSLKGDDLGLVEQKLFWLLFRRFFKWVHQSVQQMIPPRAGIEVAHTATRLQIRLTANGYAFDHLDDASLLDAGNDTHFFELRERIRRMGGYFKVVTHARDACILVSLPVSDVAAPSREARA